MRRWIASAWVALALPVHASCGKRLAAADVGALPGGWALGCERDDPFDTCDWKVTISDDRSLGSDHRLVVFFRNHLGGTGSRQLVTVYGCHSGKIEPELRRAYRDGVEVERASGRQLVIRSGVWLPTDSHASPSLRRWETFVWNSAAQRYVRRGNRIAPAQDSAH